MPTIDPAAAALDALVEHLSDELETVTVLRGWPDADTELEMPCLTAHVAGRPRVTACAPGEVDSEEDEDGALLVTYRVAYLELPIQLDLWATHRAARDDLAPLVEAALHNMLPRTSGLWLDSDSYHGRPLSFRATTGPRSSDGDAATGEWRQTWELVCDTDLVAQATHPAAAEVVLETVIQTLGLTISETTTID